MEENEFWIALWRTVGLVLFGAVAAIASCTSNTNYQIRQEIAHGASPLEVACAHGNDGSSVACALLASKH